MLPIPRRTRLLAPVVPVLLLGLALPGAGTAAAPAPNPARIYACITPTFSTLNLSTKNRVCPTGQRKISWNTAGRGVRGLRGLPGPRGPAGAVGAKGETGATGPAGSPDTPADVLAKIKTVDGAGSGLDAEFLGGVALTDLQRRVTGTCAAGQALTAIGADGTVTCAAVGSGDITGVTAGNGLTGGATSGDAALAVAVPLTLTQPTAGSADPVASLTQAGIGDGLEVTVSNAGSGGRGIDVSHAGAGPGVFASTIGNSLWGVTSSISSAAVIGDSSSGEVVVGRQNGAVCSASIGKCNGIGAVVGRHDGEGGYGVRGFVTDPLGGIGVLGQTGISGGTGTGVRGENVNAANPGNGVVGATNGTGAAILGQSTNATPLAGRFVGNVEITGDLTVSGVKSGFRIDDPRAPTQRTLTHTPVESDQFTVVYTGNVTTGKNGLATVTLPSYAAAVAGDWRYQLTPIGRFGQVIVERKLRGGRFVVRTENPRTEVSWEVTGIRKDAFAKSRPLGVVTDKTGRARGRYVHPEAYGKPASLGEVQPLPATTARSRAAGDRPPLASEQGPRAGR